MWNSNKIQWYIYFFMEFGNIPKYIQRKYMYGQNFFPSSLNPDTRFLENPGIQPSPDS